MNPARLPRSVPLRSALGVLAIALTLAACGTTGRAGTNPQVGNATLSEPPGGSVSAPPLSSAATPSPSPLPPAPCTTASAAAVREVTAALTPGQAVSGAKVVTTIASEQDASGWPTYFLAGRLSTVAGSPVGLWAVADPQTPSKVLALNAAALRVTTSRPTVSSALRTQLAEDTKAGDVSACV